MILAAISISAALVETWFLGDLLGISSLTGLELLVLALLLSLVGALVRVVSVIVAGCSETTFGELMGFRSLLPLM